MDIVSANLSVAGVTDTTGELARPVGVYEVTQSWLAGQATWNRRLTATNWSTPGAAIAAQPAVVNNDLTGPAGHPRSFWITGLVQDWASGKRPYHGLMIRYLNEDQSTPVIYLDNSATNLMVWWVPRLNSLDSHPDLTQQLGERRTATLDLAAGALQVTETDVYLSGVAGLDNIISRSYNSRVLNSSHSGSYDLGGTWSLDVPRLVPLAGGDVWLAGTPEQSLAFHVRPGGQMISPPGYRGTIYKLANGAWVLTSHDTGTQMVFGLWGHLAWIVDRNGNQIDYNYSYVQALNNWLLTSVTDTLGSVTTIGRNSDHRITRLTDPAGRQHNYGYTYSSQTGHLLTSYTDPAGKVTQYQYQGVPGSYPPAVLDRITDPAGNQTRITYALAAGVYGTPASPGWLNSGSFHRPATLRRVADNSTGQGPTHSFEYLSWKTKVTDPNNKVTTYSFDRLGRVTETTDALGKKTTASYTAAGFVHKLTDQAGKTTTFEYDQMDNPIKTTLPTGIQRTAAYTNPAHPRYPSQATNSQGHAFSLGYDTPGNLNRQGRPDTTELVFAFNPNGTIKNATDPKGNLTTFDYFGNGNLKQINPPLNVGKRSYTYDNLSRVKTVTDALNQTTTYTYDVMDRVTKTEFAGGAAIINVYDAAGRLTRSEDLTGPGLLDPTHITSYTYDRLNRQLTKSVVGRHLV